MEQIPIRDLTQNTAAVLERVEHGESIEITNHGKLVARIVPAGRGELDDLIAAGKVVPATLPRPFPRPTYEPATGEMTASEALQQLRDEERY